jgi:hypothetical protein
MLIHTGRSAAIAIAVMAAFVILGLAAPQLAAAEDRPPVVLFTDIVSGPNTGGEDNNGIYLSIFGHGFGSSRGNSKVRINGVEVAAYKYWGAATAGAEGIQQISVQPGSAVSSGPIKVTVGGVDSNTEHTFTVRSYPSKIWFVSLSGDQDSCQAGDITKPCRSVTKTYSSKASPGDFIVIRGGNWTDTDGDGAWIDLETGGGDRCTPPECASPSDKPWAFVGYPGENVTYDGDRSGCPVVMKNWEEDNDQEMHREGLWLTNIDITTCSQKALRLGRSSSLIWDDYVRFVNLSVIGQGCSDTGTISISKGNHLRMYGIRMVGTGLDDCDNLLAHSIYFSKRTDDARVGWSDFANFGGGGVIQARASDYSSEPAGVDYHTNIWVHDSIIRDAPTLAIAFAQSSGRGMKIFNNVIYNTGHYGGSSRSGIRLRDRDVSGNVNNPDEPTLEIEIYNNTIYNIGTGSNVGCFEFGNPQGPGALVLRNNICVAFDSDQEYVENNGVSQETRDNTVSSHNLWYGGDPESIPSWIADDTDVNADPKFVAPGAPTRDFRLQADSPAIDAGVNTGISRDIASIPRPQGAAYDLGAHEWRTAGPPDTEAPSRPTNVTAGAESPSRIELSWSAAGDNVGVTSYKVYRSSTSGGPYTEVGSTSSTGYSDTGLTPSATYHYVIRAFDAAGNGSANSTEASATLPELLPPPAPDTPNVS